MKRALLSVSDKEGIVEVAKDLIQLGYEIISTGGTKKILEESGIEVLGISELIEFPEIMNGRVKTLHPKIHGGLLCLRDNEEHLKELKKNKIDLIDIAIVNLYPFKSVLEKKDSSHEELIENIDIGGPSMLRSAAKNYKFVTVCVDPKDYKTVLEELKIYGKTKLETREKLAAKVFRYTSAYDTLISNYLSEKLGEEYPEKLNLTFEKVQNLRYGENPHQTAAFYKNLFVGYSIVNSKQLNGKELSFNNIQDANAALEILKEYEEPTIVAVKHMNPCGIGSAENIENAWKKAYEADPVSIFGGIVASNVEINEKIAKEMNKLFLEIIIAPNFNQKALEILKEKKNIRVLELKKEKNIINNKKIVSVMDGLLIQDYDFEDNKKIQFEVVTKEEPTKEEIEELLFAWKAVKHVKSNAIVISKNKKTLGIGAGQMNRVGAAKIALEQAGDEAIGSMLASDAFFPMSDTVELAVKYGIRAIVQPGGSVKDQLSIDVCNKYGIKMIFIKTRHFKH